MRKRKVIVTLEVVSDTPVLDLKQHLEEHGILPSTCTVIAVEITPVRRQSKPKTEDET